MAPLEGITVVALEQVVAAPLATRHLADLGARVIKIERPGIGDFVRGYDTTVNGLCSHFVWLNRSKESITLDVKQPEAITIVHQLLEDADVFIQNLAPGAAGRIGLGSAALLERYPRLVAVNVSGYGPEGPYRDKKAYDLLVQAETGMVASTGTVDAACKAGIPVADIAAGMYAFSGIVTALFQRERAGGGTVLDVSLFDALGEWMGFPAYYTAYGGTPPRRSGAHHAAIAPYGAYTAGDGKIVMLGIQNQREWRRFCQDVLGQGELADDPRFHDNTARVTHRDELDRIVNASFSTRDAPTVISSLEQAGIANARLNEVQEFWDHPQLAGRGRWREVGSPAGPIRALLPPLDFRDGDVRMDPVPDVGEHTEAILLELGYEDGEIEDFRRRGIV